MPTVKEIRVMARDLGLQQIGKLSKADLIRQVQSAEGNAPCFERIPDCRQIDCLWRRECLDDLDVQ